MKRGEQDHGVMGLLRRSDLKKRGWTDAMIRDLLPEPCETRPNPVVKSGAPMALYKADRVWRVERSPRFQEMCERARKRKQAAKKAVASRHRETIKWAKRQHIRVVRVADPVGDALEQYNQRTLQLILDGRIEEHERPPASRESDQAFLDRITVNYLRHQLTPYESLLEQKYGSTGVQDAVRVIRRRVYQAIAQAYPEFKDECDRQLEARERLAPGAPQ